MNSSEFYTLRDEFRENLQNRSLFEVIDTLEKMASLLRRASLVEEVRLLRQDYTMLLGVVKEEFFSVSRSDYFFEIREKARVLCDDIVRCFVLNHTNSPVARVWQRLKLPPEQLADIYIPLVESPSGHTPTIAAVLADPLASYQQQFDVVWSSPRWSQEERRQLYDYITDDQRPTLNRFSLVGAVGLGFLNFYDPQKLHLLLDLVHPERVEITVRATLMIIFAYAHYESRILFDNSLRSRIIAFFADETYQPLVRTIQRALAVVVESPRLSKELENEMSQALAKKQEVEEIANQETVEDVEQLLEDNPRLKKFHEGMMDLVQDFVDMHTRGIDINYSSFRSVPDMLPFFAEAANWFCPFSLDHPLLFNINAALRFLGIMSREKSCDTDRYAMVLAMASQVPEIHIVKHDAETDEDTTIDTSDVNQVVEHLAESVETINEQRRRSLIDIKEGVLFPLVVCAVQDSFRFFNLFQGVERSDNPFHDDLNLWHYASPLSAVLYADDSYFRMLANLHCDLNNFKIALELYARVLKPNLDDEDVDTLRRIAFCHTQLVHNEQAIEYYRAALRLVPDDEWTLLQLLYCYQDIDAFEEAEAVNRRLVAVFPDNHQYERYLGELFLRQEKYDDALQIFLKLDYLHPDRRSILRGLAWAHLALGHYPEAQAIYDRLLGHPAATPNDYLNAGHCAILQGDCTTAVAYYQQGIKVSEEAVTPDDIFINDIPFLLERGMDYPTLKMVTDMVKM